MLLPRIGALILLVGLGFAVAQVAQLLFVVAVEGYASWIPLVLFLVPVGAVAAAAAVLVLRRHRLGTLLLWPLVVLTVVVCAVTILDAVPVGPFLADYEKAALARGVEVPQYRREQGWDAERYVEHRASDVRSQGVFGALAAVGLFVVLVRVSGRRRAPRAAPTR